MSHSNAIPHSAFVPYYNYLYTSSFILLIMLITASFEMYGSFVKPDKCGHLLTIPNRTLALKELHILKSDLHSMNLCMYVCMYVCFQTENNIATLPHTFHKNG